VRGRFASRAFVLSCFRAVRQARLALCAFVRRRFALRAVGLLGGRAVVRGFCHLVAPRPSHSI